MPPAHAAQVTLLGPGPDDAAAVLGIERESFVVPDGGDLRAAMARPWSLVWVARPEPGARPVGYLAAWHVADELHVLSVATLPAARRRGHARAMLIEAIAFARAHHVRLVLLEVRRSNRAALRLYRALGFRAMGVRPRYYADNDEDAVEMLLTLDPATGQIRPGRDEVRLAEE